RPKLLVLRFVPLRKRGAGQPALLLVDAIDAFGSLRIEQVAAVAAATARVRLRVEEHRPDVLMPAEDVEPGAGVPVDRRLFPYRMAVPRRRGSSVSRSESPRKLNDITSSPSARPGKTAIHQATAKYERASPARSLPNDGWPTGSPAPRKLRDDSMMIAAGNVVLATTIMIGVRFGRMWRNISRDSEQPMARPAST